jgi:hypothetical protein
MRVLDLSVSEYGVMERYCEHRKSFQVMCKEGIC